MGKTIMNNRLSQTITEEEIAQLERESRERDKTEPRIADIQVVSGGKTFLIELRHSVRVECPVAMFDDLQSATSQQIAAMTVTATGNAVHWPELDVQMSTIALLQIALRMQSLKYAVSKAGSTRTEKKAAAARANGQKGGRPRKQPVPAL